MARRSFFDSVRNALNGIGQGFARGRNFRIQLGIFVLICIAGWLRAFSAERWAIIFLVSGLVLALELMNTALETLADRLHPTHHQLVGLAKDLAAGAVLVASCAALLIAVLFLIQ